MYSNNIDHFNDKSGWYVKLSFNKDFVSCMAKLYKKYGETVFAVQGIANRNCDIAQFSKEFFKSGALAEVSIDANANVKDKNIISYTSENSKAINKLNSLYLIHKWVKKYYSKKDADEAVEKVISGEIFVSDLTNFSLPYCFAFDIVNLMREGMPFYSKNMKINPPKRSSTFIDLVIQTTAYISNSIMGACAYPSMFVALDYYYRKEFGDDYTTTLTDHEKKETLFNHFQKLIFSFNFPFRSSNQSAFTNLSILDRGFLNNLFKGFAYPDGSSLDVQSTYELSKMFFEYFDSIYCKEGVFTFPVMTMAISTDENNEFIDPEFVDWVAKVNGRKSFANVFISKPTRFSSCCFHGSQEVTVKVNGNIMTLPINQLNGVRYDNIFEVSHIGGWVEGLYLKLPRHNKKLFKVETIDGNYIIVTEDHINPTNRGDVATQELCLIDCLMKADGSHSLIKSIEEYESDDEYVYCFEMKDKEDPYFTLPNGIITHNCRLINDYDGLDSAGFTNSFGVGGISIGSHRVVGLNLPRISLLESQDSNVLEKDIDICHKILFAHRQLLKDKIKRGYMPLYTHGWISLNNQYSTIGFVGGHEYVKNKGLDIKTDEGSQVLINTLKKIEGKIKVWQDEEKNIYNIEQIPAESMAVRLAKLDSILGYNEDKLKLYSNQYIPLVEDANIYDRFRLQGRFDQLTSGGSIAHINISDEKPLEEKHYRKLINTARLTGTSYFGVNYCYCECDEDHWTIGKSEVCPVCGSKIIAKYTRVVGFVTPVPAFNPIRRDWEFDRRIFYKNDDIV